MNYLLNILIKKEEEVGITALKSLFEITSVDEGDRWDDTMVVCKIIIIIKLDNT